MSDNHIRQPCPTPIPATIPKAMPLTIIATIQVIMTLFRACGHTRDCTRCHIVTTSPTITCNTPAKPQPQNVPGTATPTVTATTPKLEPLSEEPLAALGGTANLQCHEQPCGAPAGPGALATRGGLCKATSNPSRALLTYNHKQPEWGSADPKPQATRVGLCWPGTTGCLRRGVTNSQCQEQLHGASADPGALAT